MKPVLGLLVVVLAYSACEAPQEKTARSASSLYESDDNNCGALGYVCRNGRTCSDSRCSPAWQPLSTTDAPNPRGVAAAGTVDNKYIIFGGCASTSPYSAPDTTVGFYNPSNDTWTTTTTSTARAQHAAVSMANSIWVYGGIGNCWNGTAVGHGLAAWYKNAEGWYSTEIPGRSHNVYSAAFIKNGSEFMVFGGSTNDTPAIASAHRVSFGDIWTDVSCPLESCERTGSFTGFLDGTIVRFWGGGPFGNAPNGLQFNLSNNTWSAWTVPNGTPDFETLAPLGTPPRFVDTGDRLLYPTPSGTVMIYSKSGASWSEDTLDDPPSGYCSEGPTAWVNGEMIAWSGMCGGNFSTVGYRYQPPAP